MGQSTSVGSRIYNISAGKNKFFAQSKHQKLWLLHPFPLKQELQAVHISDKPV